MPQVRTRTGCQAARQHHGANGITEDDLEALSGEIGSLSDLNDLVPAGSDGTDDDAPHETDPVAAGTLPGQPAGGSQEETRTRSSRKENKKRKYLNNYCENLTQKAAEAALTTSWAATARPTASFRF